MKILFLHMSDMHINNKSDINIFCIQKMVDSVQVTGKFDHVIIVASGDIANSGQAEQYKFCWYLFGTLINKLKKNYDIKSKPTVLVVPGNHDVDLSKGDLGHAKLQKLYKKNEFDNYILEECNKLCNFMNFANGNYCFNKNEQIYFRRKIVIDGFSIEANLLNSALFSTRDEDKGLHYIPQHIINKLSEPSGADFVISIMHHSPHWFIDRIKHDLEQILLSKSSILFLGHEHILETQVISYNKNPSVRVLAGGALCNDNNWNDSEYFTCILDTDTFEFIQYGFRWNTLEKIYEHRLIESIVLPRKPSCEKRLIPCSNYLNTFFEDVKHPITKDFTDYFVFPRLQSEEISERTETNEIINEEDFLSELEKKKKIIIVGYDNSGKTTLLKYLFKILSKNKVVLFCDIYSIRSGNCKRIIKNVFEDIYGDNQADYWRFEQTPIKDRVLIIDDIHKVDTNNFNSFIEDMEKNFGYIIYSTRNVMELDVHERIKMIANDDKSYIRYKIMPFYSDKRNELISNIVRNKLVNDKDDHVNITNILIDSLKKQRSLFTLNPDFIIQYTEYYCNNIKEATQNDGEIFSKVFEASIVNAVLPYLKGIKVDKLFIILDKIAYFIHSNKAYPVSIEKINDVITSYNEKYGTDVDISSIIQILTSAKILARCGNSNKYKFCNKNYLAYFVAREIRRKYHEERDDTDLIKILNYSCFGINGDILLFLTYITDNPNMLRLIWNVTEQFTKDWTEFDLNTINIPYLANIEPLKVTPPTLEEKSLEEESEIEEERINNNKPLDPIDIYDYKEEDINKLYNQLTRGVSLLSVIARCLPNFEHMMLKEDKELFINSIYKLPNKIFYIWASEVENNKKELIELIKELQEKDYSRSKKITEEDIIKMLQWDSMSLLLDIMNMAIINSTKENTEQYLNSFNYTSKITYYLEHLMVLEKREKILDFIKEADTVFNATKNIFTRTMVKRIARHLVLYSRNINRAEIQKLEEKFFPDINMRKRLLIQRTQISKEK